MSFYQQFQKLPSKHLGNDDFQLIQEKVDRNQTYSFDYRPPSIFQSKPDKPFIKLHQQLNDKLTKLNNLRELSDQENQDLTRLRQFLLKLNTTIHDNAQLMKELRKDQSMNNKFLLSMYQQHNNLLKEQITYFQELPNFDENNKSVKQLNQKVSLLQKEIQEEKSRIPITEEKDSQFDEKEKIKLKIQYLKDEYEQLDEYIHKEIEFEKEEDTIKIAEFTRTISNLTKEINKEKELLNQSKTTHLSLQYSEIKDRIKNAKLKIVKFNNEIISLRTEKEKINASIDIERENYQRLKKELDTLKKLESLKSSH